MEKIFHLFILLLSIAPTAVYSQSNLAAFQLLTEKDRFEFGTIAINNTSRTLEQVTKLGLPIVHQNKYYIYVKSSINELQTYVESNQLDGYIVDYFKPEVLADSVRAYHRVNDVHLGNGLSQAFTGEDIIIGFVDTGIEIDHPDFKDVNGNSRILRIWDQTEVGSNFFSHYGYGILWDNTSIDNGLCTHGDEQAHGTTVAGIAVGNGLAAGENKGIAPNADIVMVKYSSQGGSWANKVTDGIEYIYKLADSLGKKAVVNVSLGAYLGSHDGMDPATLRAVDLVNEKNGRILVTACGNSGNIGKYHVGKSLNNSRGITFLYNESQTIFGPNRVFFDGYSPMDSIDFQFAFTVINPTDGHSVRGTSNFRPIFDVNNTTVVDTIRNSAGQILARIEFSGVIEGPNFHYNVLARMIDSFDYQLGFATMGSGRWDLWSGNGLGYNRLVDNVEQGQMFLDNFPYVYPDLSQTVVSGWTCHPEIISVGNIRNRLSFMTQAGIVYTVNAGNDPGEISINSSKGPNRRNHIKPDVVATGDVILAAGPFSFLNAHPEKTTPSGFHMTNGGTSMASPVVAAIGALYLEGCEDGNQKGFLKLLKETSLANNFMSNLPNNTYGAGFVNALGLIKKSEAQLQVGGARYLCEITEITTDPTQSVSDIIWDNGFAESTRLIEEMGAYHYEATNQYGCQVKSDTLTIDMTGHEITLAPITQNFAGQYLYTSGAETYVWFVEGMAVPGVNGAQLPFNVNGTSIEGRVVAKGYSSTNCIAYTQEYILNLGVEPLPNHFFIYPNPSRTEFFIEMKETHFEMQMLDAAGRQVNFSREGIKVDVSNLERGVYIVKLEVNGQFQQTKVVIE